ncbi:MAG: ABC transporter permease [Limnochordia bacterium]|jgi:peptide/nickel transport system permease protein
MHFLRLYWKSSRTKIGTIVLLAVLAFGFVGPLIAPADPFEMVGFLYERPSKKHVLGTDNFGRDVFISLMYGTRTSVIVGFLAGVTATAIGTVIGSFAGYRGGLADSILNSITNLFTVVPSFVILILISISLRTRNIPVMAFIIGITSWPWVARSVRSQVLSLRNRAHVDMARISGFSTPRVLLEEIIPYILSYVFMAFILQVAGAVLNEATLSMLGLGPYQVVSLGGMMNWALTYEAVRTGNWWAFIPPVVMVALITYSLKYINTGLDELFNPRLSS